MAYFDVFCFRSVSQKVWVTIEAESKEDALDAWRHGDYSSVDISTKLSCVDYIDEDSITVTESDYE